MTGAYHKATVSAGGRVEAGALSRPWSPARLRPLFFGSGSLSFCLSASLPRMNTITAAAGATMRPFDPLLILAGVVVVTLSDCLSSPLGGLGKPFRPQTN